MGSKITDGNCSHEIKWRLFLGRKAMTNLDSVLKSRDRTSSSRWWCRTHTHLPPARAPKSQLAVEKPSTGGHWDLPKRHPTSQDKEEAAERQQEGHNHDKIKSHSRKVGDPQNNTKEVLPLLWRFWTPCQASQPRNPTKELRNPRESELEGQQDLITRFSQARGNRDSVSEGTNKTLYAPRLRGKEQWLHGILNQNYLLLLKGLLWRSGLAGAHHRDGGTGSSSLGRSPLA